MNDALTPSASGKGTGLSPRLQWMIVGLISAALVVVLLAWALIAHAVDGKKPASAAAAAKTDQVTLTDTQLKAMKFETVPAVSFQTERITDGNIALNDDTTTPVFSPLSGKVTRLIAKPGDLVRQGAPLMEVEASEYVQGENDLLSNAAAFKAAQTQLNIAEQNENRQHELFLSNAGAKKDWQQSQADLATAQSNERSAQTALASARSRLRILGHTDAEIEKLENETNPQKGSAASIVVAPISGTVVQRQVGLGQYIVSAASGEATPVFSISNLNTVWLIANLREGDAPLVQLGQPVEVQVLAFPNKVFHARVTWVSPTVDPATHRVAVRAQIDNPGQALKPMMSARFSIGMGDASVAPAIPESAIVYEGSDAHVWMVASDNTLTARQIHTGRSKGELVEVVSGLNAGEKIVTSGNLFIDRVAQGDS